MFNFLLFSRQTVTTRLLLKDAANCSGAGDTLQNFHSNVIAYLIFQRCEFLSFAFERMSLFPTQGTILNCINLVYESFLSEEKPFSKMKF